MRPPCSCAACPAYGCPLTPRRGPPSPAPMPVAAALPPRAQPPRLPSPPPRHAGPGVSGAALAAVPSRVPLAVVEPPPLAASRSRVPSTSMEPHPLEAKLPRRGRLLRYARRPPYKSPVFIMELNGNMQFLEHFTAFMHIKIKNTRVKS
ncbi:hypothetical protein U9M48_035659 [Paspalum notatum var. saurae]|uniref:Uncharacterized protein n=1 Tax=Paspalum notatum var. saurae TaxID=547442 RepID=A0AAQ3X988_PASNO